MKLLPMAAALAASCSAPFEQDTGAGGAGGHGATTSSSTSGTGGGCGAPGDECGACLATQCSDVACRCWGDPECTGIFACYAATCPNAPSDLCSKYCLNQHASGISLAALYGHCAASACMAECPPLAGTALSDCQACAYAECATEMNACLASAPCYDWLACLATCGTTLACADTCGQTFPASAPASDVVLECATASCSQTCF